MSFVVSTTKSNSIFVFQSFIILSINIGFLILLFSNLFLMVSGDAFTNTTLSYLKFTGLFDKIGNSATKLSLSFK